MAVVQRGDVWQVQVRVGKDPRTGQWIRKSATADTEAEAEKLERRLLAEVEANRARWVEPNRARLADYLQGWLERKAAEGLAAKTLHDYHRCVVKIITPALGTKLLSDLSPAAIQAWQDAMATRRDERGATMAALAYRVLRSALSDAHRLGMIPANPAKSARPAQRSPRKREGFTLEEARRVLGAAQGERLEPFFAFVLHSGLRTAEALGLRWEDVDLDGGELTVRRDMVEVNGAMVAGKPKTQRSARTFAVLPQAVADIRRQKAQQAQERLQAGAGWTDEGLVFAAENGHPLRLRNVDRAFRRIRERAGVRPLPTYSLRHATAAILLAAGADVGVAAKMMGHSVAMFCETYADLLVESTRDVAAKAGRFLDVQEAAAATGDTPARRGRPRQAR